jgi:hypothetical protein
MERLALVRNQRIDWTFIEALLDINDQILKVEFAERLQLALAFLTNPVLEELKMDLDSRLTGDSVADQIAIDSTFFAETHLARIWDLASKWPDDSKIPGLVYLYVPVSSWMRERTYAACQNNMLRSLILQSSTCTDKGVHLLAMRDQDGACRRAGWEKAWLPPNDALDAVLKGDDKDALWGIVTNSNLPYETVMAAGSRLVEIGEPEGVSAATSERTRRGKRPRN